VHQDRASRGELPTAVSPEAEAYDSPPNNTDCTNSNLDNTQFNTNKNDNFHTSFLFECIVSGLVLDGIP